ncbi:hypothetical protein V1292_006107 [Bradyrhizobium sp. AZCC 1719]|uniref:hypothetical protein n=1 Tax=Bradyrhizobium sp. AZCC 1719 TaxID=3117028 RepID=UPI002FF0F82D
MEQEDRDARIFVYRENPILMMMSTGAAITESRATALKGDCIERHVEGDHGGLTEVAFELTARFRAVKACRISRSAWNAAKCDLLRLDKANRVVLKTGTLY